MTSSGNTSGTQSAQFSIGAVAKLTGISSHTLRVWERRHRAVVAHRLASGRRVYNQRHIDRLLLLKRCINNGDTISSLASLDDEALSARLQQLLLSAQVAGASPSSQTKAAMHPQVKGLDRDDAQRRLSRLLVVGECFHVMSMLMAGPDVEQTDQADNERSDEVPNVMLQQDLITDLNTLNAPQWPQFHLATLLLEGENLNVEIAHDKQERTLQQNCRPELEQVSLLIVDKANITGNAVNQLLTLIDAVQCRHVVVIYRFSTRDHLDILRHRGVTLLRAPLEESMLSGLMRGYIIGDAAFGGDAVVTVNHSIEQLTPHHRVATTPHLFSDDQLAKITQLPSAIECECPRHLGELVANLSAFEHYSAECVSKNNSDAAMHAKIQGQTARARHLLEQVLQEVLTLESIDL